MIQKEWQKLFHSKFLVVAVLAIAFIPTLYSTIFLASMWDPYGQLNNLPVAVVNEDQPVQYNGKTMQVGSDLVERLKKEKPLKFAFVSPAAARAGIRDRTYYMVVTIPADFSRNATTLLDSTPKKMELNYQVNSGSSFIGSKLSTSASMMLTKEVSTAVTKTYAETLFEKLGEMKSGLSQAADGAQQLDTGSKQLAQGNQTIAKNLQVLAHSSLTFRDGAQQLKVGLDQYQAGAAQLANGTQALASNVGPLQSGMGALANGADSLNSGVKQYTQGAGSVQAGLQQLTKNNDSLRSGASQLSGGIAQMHEQIPALTDGLQRIGQGGKKLQQGLDTYTAGVGSLAQNAQILQNKGTALDSGAAQMAQQTKQLAGATKQLSDALSAALSSGKPVDAGTVALLQKNLADLSEKTAQLSQGADQLSGGVKAYTGGTAQLAGGLQKLDSNSASLQAGAAQITAGAQAIGSKAPALAQGVQKLEDGSRALSNGIQAYTQGTQKLAEGSTQLTQNSAKLVDGSAQLRGGLSQVNAKVPVLVSGVEKLNAGAQKLSANTGALTGGAQKLANGAVQISGGAGQLANGSNTLGNGLQKLQTGAHTLATKLQDGNQKVAMVKGSNATADMMSEPVKSVMTDYAQAKNNLHGMAPYMMSIALFIGGIVMCFIYPVFDPAKAKPNTGVAWWASKASVWMLVAVVQAVAEVSLLRLLNGFSPIEVGKTYLVSILTSMAFMSVISLFNVMLGRVGAFIMILFMILQISGSAGTYPIEITNGFYMWLRPYLPMTYSVDALRQTITMGSRGVGIGWDLFILTMVLLFSTFLCVIFYSVRVLLNEKGHQLQPSILQLQMQTR